MECVDHVPTLLFSQHGFARTTFLLDYLNLEKDTQNIPAAIYYLNFPLPKRWDNLQELALAEMAAFSGGGGVASEGRPQATYRAFFKKHAELFAGWRPVAPAAVLYAYWGPNPLSPYHGDHPPTIHEHLITSHRPYVTLIDARLPERATELAGYGVLYSSRRPTRCRPSNSRPSAITPSMAASCSAIAGRRSTGGRSSNCWATNA